MPTTKELTIRLGDPAGTLGKVCRALADHKVNIVAFESIPLE
jgi:prephenate dehydratase